MPNAAAPMPSNGAIFVPQRTKTDELEKPNSYDSALLVTLIHIAMSASFIVVIEFSSEFVGERRWHDTESGENRAAQLGK